MTNTVPTIATICSHSALQIFHGAKSVGLPTLGICTHDKEEFYRSFPEASPDELLAVDRYEEILSGEIQSRLNERNAIIIPHGSFVEYVGSENLLTQFEVPVFGNKYTLEWESDRTKERKWLKSANIRIPRTYDTPAEIDGTAIVKFSGAKGGEGFFLVRSEEEFHQKIGDSEEDYTIQEWIDGTRYYPHYYYSPGKGRLEILGIDRRDESNIDEYYRAGEGEKSFVVVGNKPLVARESLLPQVYEMGKRLVKSSKKLFPPGLLGPFCLETICTNQLEFVTFEVSGRIVAGTNLYPKGSPYSPYYFDEPMSTGKRIAREVNRAHKMGDLSQITS
ncbi:MAG: formate--phosphoribosylaminoimidazolecarboxamide ligase [Candidatus Bipolaricaulota bacterium]